MGEAGSIHRDIELGQDEGKGAGMVFVTVGYENAPDLIPPFQQVADVRDDQVNAGHVLLWEEHTAIYCDDVLVVLQDHHVLSDFPQPSQGNNSKG